MPLSITLEATDEATPLLKQLAGLTDDRERLNQKIADQAAVLTANHLKANDKHVWADKLKGQRTGYFAKKGEGVEAHATEAEAIVSIPTGDGREAFAHLEDDITIKPREMKWLTVPNNGAAYGHRAREFDFLKFIQFTPELAALVQQTVTLVPGKRKPLIKKTINNVFYWLRKSVLIKKDRSMLPTDAEYLAAAEAGAGDYFELVEKEAVSGN